MADKTKETSVVPDPVEVQARLDKVLAELKILRRLLRLAEEQEQLAKQYEAGTS